MAESSFDLPVVGSRGTDRLARIGGRAVCPALARTVFRFRQPSQAEVVAVARANAGEPYSYRRVGATGGLLQLGVERQSVLLGYGAAVFQRAIDAVKSWSMLHLDWVEAMPLESPPRPGQVVAFASRQLGIWSINTYRVVYVIEPEEGPVIRYGLAYGTLRTHPLSGEERFTVEWDRVADTVHFEITRFTGSAHPLIQMLHPLPRLIQQRFARDALEAVRRAVQEEG